MNIQEATKVYPVINEQAQKLDKEFLDLNQDLSVLHKEKTILTTALTSHIANSQIERIEESTNSIDELTQSIDVLQARLTDVMQERAKVRTTLQEVLECYKNERENTLKQYDKQREQAVELHAQLFIIVQGLNAKREQMMKQRNTIIYLSKQLKTTNTEATVEMPEALWKLLDELSLDPTK